MSNKSKTLVFFGSGPVAAQSLDFLVGLFDIEVIITKSIHSACDINPVLAITDKHQLKSIFANNKDELDDVFKSLQIHSPVGLIIDYGVIVSQSVIDIFRYGIINSHFSQLPEWRGADPITYALLSGQPSTGVCLMKINDKLDEGDIIGSSIVNITPEDDNCKLSSKLIEASNKLLLDKLPLYLEEEGNLSTQTGLVVTYSQKISKNYGAVDWSKPASVIEREIRAYGNWPGSYTKLGNLELTICQARASINKLETGKLWLSPDNDIFIGCRVGSLQLLQIKPHGKNIMSVKDLLNGYKNQLGLIG